MTARGRHGRLAALLLTAWPSSTWAQAPAPSPDVAPTGGRPAPRSVVTPTRTAVLFGGFERELADAVGRKDRDTLDRLLHDDFELRSSAHPGEPTPIDVWEDTVLAAPPTSYRISEVAVHEAGPEAALVSFVYEQEAKAPGPSGRFVFVDLWLKDGAGWRLRVRHACPVGGAEVPGWAPGEPEIPKK